MANKDCLKIVQDGDAGCDTTCVLIKKMAETSSGFDHCRTKLHKE